MLKFQLISTCIMFILIHIRNTTGKQLILACWEPSILLLFPPYCISCFLFVCVLPIYNQVLLSLD